MLKHFILFVSFFIFTASSALGSEIYPGFKTMGIWDESGNVRLDLCIWYPVQRPPRKIQYEDWVLSVNRSAKPLPGRFPVVIISHDSSGNRFVYHNLATMLVKAGFVVIAPTHQTDNIKNMRYLYTARQLTERIKELNYLVESLHTNAELNEIVDTNRIGMLGFGAGATTALFLAGGQFNTNLWNMHKLENNPKSPYNNQWMQSRVDDLFNAQVLKKSHEDYRIRSIMLVTPLYSQFFSKNSLSKVRVPVFLVGVEHDKFNSEQSDLIILRDAFKLPTNLLYIKEASPLMLMAECVHNKNEVLPEDICLEENSLLKNKVFTELGQVVNSFFSDTLGNPNLPKAIAPEPEKIELPPPLPEPEKPKPAPKRGRRG